MMIMAKNEFSLPTNPRSLRFNPSVTCTHLVEGIDDFLNRPEESSGELFEAVEEENRWLKNDNSSLRSENRAGDMEWRSQKRLREQEGWEEERQTRRRTDGKKTDSDSKDSTYKDEDDHDSSSNED